MSDHDVREHSDAVVREYLARRGLTATLAAMDAEKPRTASSLSSRAAVVAGLKLAKLVKRNKERVNAAPLGSLLEILCEALIVNERPINVDVVPFAAGASAPRIAGAVAALAHANVGNDEGEDWLPLARPERPAAAAAAAQPPEPGPGGGSWGRSELGAADERSRRAAALSGTLLVEEDLEAESDLAVGYVSVAPRPQALSSGALPPGVHLRELGTSTAAGLSELFHGRPNAEWMASWVRQGFSWCEVPQLPFGLRQHRGGTCGVIAAVQALLLKELLAASPPVDPLAASHAQRERALVKALAGALWRCAEAAAEAKGARRVCAYLVLFPNRMALPTPRELGREASVAELEGYAQLEQAVAAKLGELQRADGAGVIAFAYSAALSAGGAEGVRAHMDATGLCSSTLLGAHGYCTQELVNLVATGKATSNVFDGDKELDEMVMRGMGRQAPVGLLSLFERYGHVVVGERLKSPECSVWITFMESHYTVVFAREQPPAHAPFDLWYYDMLAHQDYVIRLTVDPGRPAPARVEGELVPPLDDTLHTKWAGAHIDWNGVEKLL